MLRPVQKVYLCLFSCFFLKAWIINVCFSKRFVFSTTKRSEGQGNDLVVFVSILVLHMGKIMEENVLETSIYFSSPIPSHLWKKAFVY